MKHGAGHQGLGSVASEAAVVWPEAALLSKWDLSEGSRSTWGEASRHLRTELEESMVDSFKRS